jgi:hypothetical protein
MINCKKLVSVLFVCAIFTVPYGANANDTALHEAILASPLPVEQPQAEPSAKDRIQAILKEFDHKTEGVKKGNVYVPKDTQITLELIDSVSSKKNKTGDPFKLKTTEDLRINNVVILPKGLECEGVIIKASSNGIFGRGGNLEINIPSIQTRNGVNIPLNGYVKGYGRDDNGAVAVAAVVSLVGGLFMHGENIYYNQGQVFKVTVQKDTDLSTTPDNLNEAMSVVVPQGQNVTVSAAR